MKSFLSSIGQRLRPILTNEWVLFGLWMLIGVLSAVTKMGEGQYNNFLIYRGTFFHALQGVSLYGTYPAEYGDVNLYGPVFSLLIAPFALMPVKVGLVAWNMTLAALLYAALKRLRLTKYQWVFMIWFCAHELLTALFMQQFNVLIVALIVWTYALIKDRREGWAAFCVVLGTLTKIYGIVGLAFVFFARRKGKFIQSILGWILVLGIAPMVLSSFDYVVDQYFLWYSALAGKGQENLICLMQNISLLGMVRKIGYACTVGLTPYLEGIRSGAAPVECGWSTYSDLWLIIPGLIVFGAPLLRFKQWKNRAFQLTIVASVLLFVCLFSTGTESSGYIIAFVGVVLWYTAAPWKREPWAVVWMVIAFVLTSLSPSDLFPAYLRREWVQPFALKALPIAVIWFTLCYEMLTKDYEDSPGCQTSLS